MHSIVWRQNNRLNSQKFRFENSRKFFARISRFSRVIVELLDFSTSSTCFRSELSRRRPIPPPSADYEAGLARRLLAGPAGRPAEIRRGSTKSGECYSDGSAVYNVDRICLDIVMRLGNESSCHFKAKIPGFFSLLDFSTNLRVHFRRRPPGAFSSHRSRAHCGRPAGGHPARVSVRPPPPRCC